MKTFTIQEMKSGGFPRDTQSYVIAKNFKEAKVEFAKKIRREWPDAENWISENEKATSSISNDQTTYFITEEN